MQLWLKLTSGSLECKTEAPGLHNCPRFAFWRLAPVLQRMKGHKGWCTLLPLHWLRASLLISRLASSYTVVILLRSFAVPWSPLAGGRQGVLPTWGLWAGSSVPLSHAWSPMLAQKRLETPFGFKDQHAGQARALLWQQPPEVLAHQPGEGCSALGVVKAAQVPRSRM